MICYSDATVFFGFSEEKRKRAAIAQENLLAGIVTHPIGKTDA